jgi:hypothetical protein
MELSRLAALETLWTRNWRKVMPPLHHVGIIMRNGRATRAFMLQPEEGSRG